MTAIGRRIYGLGAIALGLVELKFGAFASVWLPVPEHLPGYRLVAYAAALALILAGVAINLNRTARIAALILAVLFSAGMLILQLPAAVMKPAVWVNWQAVAESTVMALGGVLAWAQLTGNAGAARTSRYLFGLCLLIFGISHFVYLKFTADFTPAWIPPSQLFWAATTGVAQIAAGLAVLSGVQARLASVLLTVMYAAFSLLVHLPRTLADPTSHDSLAENGVNLLLVGAAWLLAEALSRPKTEA